MEQAQRRHPPGGGRLGLIVPATVRLRAAFAHYEVVMGTRAMSAPELIDRPVQQQTLVLVGPDQVTLGGDLLAVR
ncbi:hypothetical protein [Nonomuraea sp. NPDC003804]|uniref:hypothetical protein n=1 Tax=Nonomuraea sp. NPDC003804 TaxID=3154547 RepID=UPI0033BDB904